MQRRKKIFPSPSSHSLVARQPVPLTPRPQNPLNIQLKELRIHSHHILPCQRFHRWRQWITLTTFERWTCSWQLQKKKEKSTRAQPCFTVWSGWTVSGRGKKMLAWEAFFYSSHTCSLTKTETRLRWKDAVRIGKHEGRERWPIFCFFDDTLYPWHAPRIVGYCGSLRHPS